MKWQEVERQLEEKRQEDEKAEQERCEDEGGDILRVIEKEGGGGRDVLSIDGERQGEEAAVKTGSWTLDSRAGTTIEVKIKFDEHLISLFLCLFYFLDIHFKMKFRL